jgi:hypothetical protein
VGGCDEPGVGTAEPGVATAEGNGIEPWMLDELPGGGGLPPSGMTHPLDRGTPGSRKNIERPRRLQ